MTDEKFTSFHTEVIHGGEYLDPYGSVTVPIYQTSTFAFENAEQGARRFAGKEKGYIYSRLGNPTVKALEDSLAALERGCGAIACASGMAAVTGVYLALLDGNSHVISTDAVYGASRTVLENEFSRFGVKADFTDTSDTDSVRELIRPNTKLIYIETPANPTMALTDISAVSAIAKEHRIPVAVDNTFSSPILQNPLELGADIVIHSLTKYLNGHSDAIGGAIIVRDEALLKRIKKVVETFGGTMDPHQAWLILRGIKTLALRIEHSQATAEKLARFLENHPKVAWVSYPGLPSHPQYELAKKQMRGPGAMIVFGLKGGRDAGRKLIDSVRLMKLAVSLGGIETLIQHPASMTHAGVPKAAREKAGITDDLIRLSVGCEGFEDLKRDLVQALAKI